MAWLSRVCHTSGFLPTVTLPTPVPAPEPDCSPQRGRAAQLLAYSSLGASMALVGSYVGFSKLLVLVFPVFLLAWLRFGIASIAMVGWVRRRPGEAMLTRHDRVLLFWESFLGNFLFSIFMLFGVAMTSALAAGVTMSAMPGVVALLSWLFLRERIAVRVIVGIGCAIGGIALVALNKQTATVGGLAVAGDYPWLGNLMLVGAVICEASYVVIGKQLTGNLSAKRISALVNLWGLALVTPIGLWQALQFDFSAVSNGNWVLLLFYSLAASMITVWLWMTGLKHVPASSAGVFTVLLPVSAAAVGVIFLGERINAMQALAFGLALLGIVLATWPARSKVD